jgi:predicted NAD-dependent protein-ADP-ribosyltransferase YbiA (DUF1768 family)
MRRADKERIVEEGNYHKFTKSKETHLEQKLLETRERELVEVNQPFMAIQNIANPLAKGFTRRSNLGSRL